MNSTIKAIFSKKIFLDFHHIMAELMEKDDKSYSYLGVNYHNEEIISLKLYYTFFNIDYFINHFPLEDLKPDFLSFKNLFSYYHLTTQGVPGCGLTFTIKFDLLKNQSSKGVYFRINDSADDYITKFLDALSLDKLEKINLFDRKSILKYISVDGNGSIQCRNYIYTNNCFVFDQFDKKSGIKFSQSKYLEISTDWEDKSINENMRIIGLHDGTFPISNEVEISTRKILTMIHPELHSTFTLYGYYVFKNIKSVFVFCDFDKLID